MDIASYYTKAKQLWDESSAVSGVPMCTCAKCECEVNGRLHNYTEEQRLIQFLMGLNNSYIAVRGNILMMSPFPSISQAYSLLIQEERQRQVKAETHFLGENTSLSTAINKTQHHLPSTLNKTDTRKSQLFCDHCRRIGHTMDRCYRLHSFPDKSQGRGRGGHNNSSRGGHNQATRGGYGQATNRRAYNTWANPRINQDNQSEAQGPLIPGLNADQSKQLLQFISNLTTSNQHTSKEQEPNPSNMAGISPSFISTTYICNAICCICKLGRDTWIIDSGASNHMTFMSLSDMICRTLSILSQCLYPLDTQCRSHNMDN